MQYLKVREECLDFKSFKEKIKDFISQYNYDFSIIVPPHLNENDNLPLYYNIPCYLKKRKNSYTVFVDLYVEDISPVNALLIQTNDLFTAELIAQKLSLYLMN